MKKTKKALLAALACSVVLVGAGAIAACNKDDGGDEGHSHSWNAWTVADADRPTNDNPGKAKRTCKNSGCDATTEQLEVTLPALKEGGYTTEVTTEATCTTAEVVEYTYTIAEGETVKFSITGDVNANAHDYTYTIVDGGHSAVCKHNSQHTIAKEDHDTKGEGGACSKCGYHEIQLNTNVTVKGATDKEPKLYYINLTVSAEEGVETNYRIMSGGAALATGDKVDLVKDGTPIDSETYDSAITIEEAGLYCVKVYEDLTFSVVPYTHKHGFDTETWSYDKTSHWNPATCKHEDEKGNEGLHSFKPETAPDEDGVAYMECGTCAYRKYNYHGTALTAGGTISPAESGNYTITLNSQKGYGSDKNYYIYQQSVTLSNTGTEAKKYTVKVLSDGTKVNSDYTKGQSYSFVLEAGETNDISIGATQQQVKGADDSLDAAFRVILEEAPEAGDILRPIAVTIGEEAGKSGVAAGEKVYFSIKSVYNKTAGEKIKFTHADGVSVYSLGTDINNAEPALVEPDDYVTLGSYGDNYFYAVSTGTDCKLTANIFYLEGEKGNPFTAKTDGTANSVALSDNTYEQWYTIEGLTSGTKYIVKVNSSALSMNMYKDPSNEWTTYAKGEEGAPIVFTADGEMLYLKVMGVVAGEFTIAKFNAETDGGLLPEIPFGVTAEGEYDVKDGTFYYAITPTENGEAVLSCENLVFWRYSDEAFETYVGHGNGELLVTMDAGTTYYIKTVNSGEATGKFNFAFREYVAHNYVITLSDGTNKYPGATVSLVYTGGEITGATDNGDGTYTLANVDPSRGYTVRVSGLPATHGYYEDETYIAKNFDETTTFTVNVVAKQEYKVKVALPTGAEGSLAGLTVKLMTPSASSGKEQTSDAAQDVYTAETDAEGIATFKVLDDNSYSGRFNVTVVVPVTHELYGKFDYFVPENRGQLAYITANAEKRDITDTPLTLEATSLYTVTLSVGAAQLEAGKEVTVNDVVYKVGADGTFQAVIRESATSATIKIDGYKVSGTVSFNKEAKTISATLIECITGALPDRDYNPPALNKIPEVGFGKDKTYEGDYDGSYCKFTASEDGEYRINLNGAGMQFNIIYYNGLDDGSVAAYGYGEIMNYRVVSSVDYTSLVVRLSAGDYVVLFIFDSGKISVADANALETIELNQDISVSAEEIGDDCKAYAIELAAGKYQVMVGGEAVSVSGMVDINILNTNPKEDMSGTISDTDTVITIDTAGTYYVAVYAETTFKVVAYTEQSAE